jgi:hypothetical protein
MSVNFVLSFDDLDKQLHLTDSAEATPEEQDRLLTVVNDLLQQNNQPTLQQLYHISEIVGTRRLLQITKKNKVKWARLFTSFDDLTLPSTFLLPVMEIIGLEQLVKFMKSQGMPLTPKFLAQQYLGPAASQVVPQTLENRSELQLYVLQATFEMYQRQFRQHPDDLPTPVDYDVEQLRRTLLGPQLYTQCSAQYSNTAERVRTEELQHRLDYLHANNTVSTCTVKDIEQLCKVEVEPVCTTAPVTKRTRTVSSFSFVDRVRARTKRSNTLFTTEVLECWNPQHTSRLQYMTKLETEQQSHFSFLPLSMGCTETEEITESHKVLFVVAFTSGTLLGSMRVVVNPGYLYIDYIVSRKKKSTIVHGVGEALLDALVLYAIDMTPAVNYISLYSLSSVRGFYIKYGFMCYGAMRPNPKKFELVDLYCYLDVAYNNTFFVDLYYAIKDLDVERFEELMEIRVSSAVSALGWNQHRLVHSLLICMAASSLTNHVTSRTEEIKKLTDHLIRLYSQSFTLSMNTLKSLYNSLDV